ncbi:MAG: dihydrolipoyllysine-residue succinyltransferase [Candidatus Lightella neohaematopini]|nr:dihydrolipoyllysine-residue succinyltransferase [Candidatus Lightella neohaematopini]
MSIINIIVPELPESINSATIVVWHKNIGDYVNYNDIIAEIETDKVILEIPAKINGKLTSIKSKIGSIVVSKQIIGTIESFTNNNKKETLTNNKLLNEININNVVINKLSNYLSPSVRRIINKYNLNIGNIIDNIKNNKKTKNLTNKRTIKYVPMSNLRKKIAKKLMKSKNNTAMVTTFNEINMKPLINIKKKYGKDFKYTYGIKLGFMSFYLKAAVEALKTVPEINTFINNDNIAYYNYFDINIAMSTENGLITPIIKNVDKLSIYKIEKIIKKLSFKSKINKLTTNDLINGNFTITNGGVFGSLISTPIINIPQSAILGLHAIKDRTVVLNKKIIILPMMYVALSYDHRIIDGREAIKFLLKIKDIIENPIKLLFNY